MVRVVVPKKCQDIIKGVDMMIAEPMVVFPDPVYRRRLGVYTKPLIDSGFLELYRNKRSHETIGVLKVKSVTKKIGNGGRTEYLFDELKVKLPTFELP